MVRRMGNSEVDDENDAHELPLSVISFLLGLFNFYSPWAGSLNRDDSREE
jgi:hypothetical protein